MVVLHSTTHNHDAYVTVEATTRTDNVDFANVVLFLYILLLFIYLNCVVVYIPQLFTLCCCCLFYSCFDGYNATVLAYGQVHAMFLLHCHFPRWLHHKLEEGTALKQQ